MNKLSIKWLVLLVVMLIWHPFLSSQELTYNIEEYNLQNGFNVGKVESFCESKNGLVWFGTSKGLVRFDGQDYKLWNKQDNELLFDITDIKEDDEGLLWLYNNQIFDFVFFDPVKEVFITKQEKFGSSFPELKTNRTKKGILVENTSGVIADGSLIFTNYGYNYFYKYHSKEGFSKVPKPLDVHKLIGVDDYLWFVSVDGTIIKCDVNGNELTRKKMEDYLANYNVRQIGNSHFVSSANIEDRSSSSFFYKIDDQLNKELISEYKKNFRYLTSKYIIDIHKDEWVVMNFDHHKLLTIDKNHFLNENMVQNEYLHEDSRGEFWIIGHHGVVNLSLSETKFERLLSSKDDASTGFPTRGIFVDQDNFYIACESGGGLKIISKKDNKVEQTIGTPKNNWPKPVIGLADHKIAFGSYVLNIYNDSTKELNALMTSPEDVNAWGLGHGIWSLYSDRNDNIWAGVGDYLAVKRIDSDSVVYHVASEIFKRKKQSSCIQNIIPEGKDSLWFCSLSGLYLFDLVSEEIVAEFNSSQGSDSYLPAESFYYIHKDENRYWLGTSSGLIEWQGPDDSQNYKVFTSREKLSNDVIYAVIEDDYDRLWLSSDYGIMAFDKTDYSISTYLEKDGIAHYESNRLSHFKDKEGYIYFGGLDGVTRFHPKDFTQENSEQPELILTGVQVFDSKEGKELDKKAEVMSTNTLNFYPTDRFFKIQCTLPIYGDVLQTTYAWKIEGVNDVWNYQNENSIQIGMLPYGEHLFSIKAKNTNGLKSKDDLSIKIIVHKPFYLKTWFILISLSSIILGVFMFFRQRTEILKRKIDQATIKIQSDKKIIEQQAKDLKKLDALKSRFFANVSHELRTPLTLMLGPINNLLKSKNQSTDNRNMLSFLQRNTLRLRGLVNEILDLSKLENSKMQLKEEPIEFYAYLSDRMKQFYSIGSSEMVTFETDISSKEELYILLDVSKFEKILNNFISNAIKFTPKDGSVKLGVEEAKDFLILTVSDTGRGIHPEDLPRIFERFYQSSQADAPTEGGTGIGLSICKELAELMNGEVKAQSTLNQGSKFSLKIPIKLAPKVVIDTVDSEIGQNTDLRLASILPEIISAKGARILVVEDNQDLREYYKIILSDYEIDLTENGQEALSYLEDNEQPDLILSDLMMPVMDGMQLIDNLKSSEKWSDIPVIMLTAKTDRQVKIKALRYGIDDYLTKPFDEEELEVRIGNLLMHSRERNKNRENVDSIDKSNMSQADKTWIDECEKFIFENLQNEFLSVVWIAQKFHMSESTLTRQVKRIIGLSPGKYINELRLNQAKQILESEPILNVNQVSEKVGYQNPKTFSRSFKRRFGKSPSEVTERLNA